MKEYKHLELLVNATLIAGFAAAFAITGKADLIFYSYFIVGGVQLVSMLWHLYKGWFNNHNLRTGYYVFLLIVLASCFAVVGIWFLLFASPLMACYYLFICYREWRILKFKELVHLK